MHERLEPLLSGSPCSILPLAKLQEKLGLQIENRASVNKFFGFGVNLAFQPLCMGDGEQPAPMRAWSLTALHLASKAATNAQAGF